MTGDAFMLCSCGATIACTSGLSSTLLFRRAVRLSIRVGAIDRPGGRKVHDGEVPRLGGLTIALGIGIGMLVPGLFARGRFAIEIGPGELVVLAATALVLILGLIDDIRDLPFSAKLVGQIAAAALMIAAGWGIDRVALPLVGVVPLGLLAPLATVLWVVGIMNAINMMDGLDGLASLIVAIISVNLFAFEVIKASPFSAFILAAVFGSCVGFLVHNWNGKIFMGDGGSMTLGFLLAFASSHTCTEVNSPAGALVPLLALAVPVFDTLLVMGHRFLCGNDRAVPHRMLAIFIADRNHLHHLFAYLVPTRRLAVLSIGGLVMLSCGAAHWVNATGSSIHGILLVALEGVVIIALRKVGMARRRQAAPVIDRSWSARPEPTTSPDTGALHEVSA